MCFTGVRRTGYNDTAIFLPNDPNIVDLIKEGFGYQANHTLSNFPLPVIPTMHSARMTNQKTCFTIHPDPKEQNRKTLEQFFNKKVGLEKYVIPRNYKHAIKRQLLEFGISRSLLFPDLDGLGEGIKSELLFAMSAGVI